MDKVGLSDESDLRDDPSELEYQDICKPLDFNRQNGREFEQTFEYDFTREFNEHQPEEVELPPTDEESLEEWLEEL